MVESTKEFYLPEAMPAPQPSADGLDAQHWDGLKEHVLKVQFCNDCNNFQWGPECMCFRCYSFNVGWREIEPTGTVYSWQRVWHPVHPALREATPYLVGLVELPQANNIRIVGNILGDPKQEVKFGDFVTGVYEDHPHHTLLQWRIG